PRQSRVLLRRTVKGEDKKWAVQRGLPSGGGLWLSTVYLSLRGLRRSPEGRLRRHRLAFGESSGDEAISEGCQ
ncbi:MAG: hypothetical protein WBC82_12470, partial [Dehalococcoidia bacterium]